MKKAGFTLAEVLITLMILGIIAALTIPSLIQNTQKKEEVVQLKKGLSMINQAVTMNYALNQEDLTQEEIKEVINNRLAVTDKASDYSRTQDGLTYYFTTDRGSKCSSSDAVDENGNNACYNVVIGVRPKSDDTATSYSDALALTPDKKGDGSGKDALTGYYLFYAGADRVVPSAKTAEILYAKDATTVSGSSH